MALRLPVVVGHVGAGAFHRQEGDVAEGDPRRRVVRRQAQPEYAVAAAQVGHLAADAGGQVVEQKAGADIQMAAAEYAGAGLQGPAPFGNGHAGRFRRIAQGGAGCFGGEQPRFFPAEPGAAVAEPVFQQRHQLRRQMLVHARQPYRRARRQAVRQPGELRFQQGDRLGQSQQHLIGRPGRRLPGPQPGVAGGRAAVIFGVGDGGAPAQPVVAGAPGRAGRGGGEPEGAALVVEDQRGRPAPVLVELFEQIAVRRVERQ